ncbi:MAG: TolC family protein [Prevotella sp.]|jgi:outer membrane protein
MKYRLSFSLALLLMAAVLPLHAQKIVTLEECRQQALEHNINTRVAGQRTTMAKEQKREAFTKYFPTVSAAGFAYHPSKDIVKGDINTSDIIPASLASSLPTSISSIIPSTLPVSLMRNGTVGSVSAVQPVFMGGRIVNGNKLAQVGVDAAEIQEELSGRQVILTTDQYYWNVVKLKEKIITVKETQKMLASLEKDVRTAVDAGVTLRNDLLQVQVKQNQAESGLLELENALKTSRRLLAQYMGADSSEFDVAAIGPADSVSLPLEMRKEPETAAMNTPESRLLEKNVESAVLSKKLEVGKYLPMVGVGVGYDYANLMDRGNNFGIVFATVAVPISGWWGGSHAIRRKKMEEQIAREQLTDSRQLLSIQIAKTWDDAVVAWQKVGIAKKSVKQSRENLRLNNQFYHAGTGNMTDLLDAQRQYQESRDQWVDAYAAYQLKISEYREMTK